MTFVFKDAQDERINRNQYALGRSLVSDEVRAFLDEEARPGQDAAEQERIDQNRRRMEHENRQRDAEAAEQHARLTGSGILPKTLPSLKSLPKEMHEQYERQYDGTFRLAHIYVDDAPNFMEHLSDIAANRIQGRERGYNPDTEQRETDARNKAVEDVLVDLEQQDRARRTALRDAELAKAQADLSARYRI